MLQDDTRLTCLGTSEQRRWTHLWHFVHWIELQPTCSPQTRQSYTFKTILFFPNKKYIPFVLPTFTVRPFPSTAFSHLRYFSITSFCDSQHKTRSPAYNNSINEPSLTSSVVHISIGFWQEHQHFGLIWIELKWIKWKRIYCFLIFLWIYFLWILWGLNMVNLIKFHKTQKKYLHMQKFIPMKYLSIYDTFFKVLILSLCSSDSWIASFSTVKKNNELMVEMASWFLLFCYIFF